MSVFIPIPKKGNAKECSNYHTIALISQASRVMLKIFKAMLQQYGNCDLLDVHAGQKKGRGIREQITNKCWIIEKARELKKIYFCFFDCAKDFVWITTNCGIFLTRLRILPDHITCLLRNMYVGQEARVRTGHGTMDCFQTGKGVCKGCILSPCLFVKSWAG